MNATPRITIGCLVASMTLSAGAAMAAHPSHVGTLLVPAVMGQSADDVAEVNKFKTIELMRKAREAMNDGKLDEANSLITKAEGLNVSFSRFHLGDTPKKLRKDLEKLQAKAGPTKPADPFAMQTLGNQPKAEVAQAPKDSTAPLGTQLAFAEPKPAAPSVIANPTNTPAAPATGVPGSAWPISTTSATTAAAAPTKDPGKRRDSDQFLLSARRALAVGDVRRAGDLLNQAKALNVAYEFQDDSPAKVENAISKVADLASRPDAEKRTESYRRRYAELQLQQAEDLMRWRDLAEAERLANEAQQSGISFGPFEMSPQNIRQRIAEARRAGGQVAATPHVEPLPPTGATTKIEVPASTVASGNPKAQCLELVKKSRAALNAGDLATAENLAKQADLLKVSDREFGPQDDRPWLVLMDVEKLRRSNVNQASAVTPISATGEATKQIGTRAVYNPSNDNTKNIPAAAAVTTPTLAPAAPEGLIGANNGANSIPPGLSQGMTLFLKGEDALRNHDSPAAQELFRQAQAHREELDPISQQRLQDRLQLLGKAPTPTPFAMKAPLMKGGPSLEGGASLEAVSAAQQLEFRRVTAAISQQESQSKQLRETDPAGAQAALDAARQAIQDAKLDTQSRDMLMRHLDRTTAELADYLQANRGRIELNERNANVTAEIEREQKVKVEVQEKLALIIDEFNTAMDEQRFAEAQLLAKRAAELAPHEPIVGQIKRQVNHLTAFVNTRDIRDAKWDGAQKELQNAELASVPFDDNNPIQFPELKDWTKLTTRRAQQLRDIRNRSERDIEIEQRLKTPVLLQFRETPLSVVMDHLQKVANVSIHLDPRGLAEEGVTSDTPVTINLSQEISLKSALNLILEPLHLSYVIKNEVLKITSEQLRDGEVYSVTYYVGDLVSPIPNFIPNGKLGLAGALADSYRGLGVGGSSSMGNAAPMAMFASADGSPNGSNVDPKVLAQFNPATAPGMIGSGGPPQTGTNQNVPFGPGGMGGGVQPDFDSLIELITGTVAPPSWTEVGGTGAIKRFETNLSLVISQTQQVHEQIADLLDQLRRLQDLQVTIEVRFITLSDNFYERIGVDMNLQANDNADKPYQIFGRTDNGLSTPYATPPFGNVLPPDTSNSAGNPPRNIQDRDLTRSESITIGMTAPGVFSSDLDIPLTQTSFAQAGNITTGTTAGTGVVGGAGLGFAILSDLEAYFFIQAVQSDIRTNVMQAPKVTLFNGQQAFVSDTTQSPFVISVIPVVGDFAAAQQPVIVVLSSGTYMTVQAVVSSDRRFVRLTVVPFFSDIGEVNTFQFEGATTSTNESSSDGPTTGTTARSNRTTTTSSGTTVQLPQFAFTTVTTTVSVPDGGTVLLGGIKRLSEQRIENGVPILSKLPYINRLFDNIGTGKSTSSLMMMVTPRIIIQEEEEQNLGVPPPTP